MTVMRWHAQDELNQEESEQNEVDGMKKGANSAGKVMYVKQRLMIRMTTDITAYKCL